MDIHNEVLENKNIPMQKNATLARQSWHTNFLHNKIMLQQTLCNNNIAFKIPSPSYVLCIDSLQANITLLHHIAQESQANILVALKGYSFWRAFEPIREKLHGATCSGVHETLLAFDTIATPLLQNNVSIQHILTILIPYLQTTYNDKGNKKTQDSVTSALQQISEQLNITTKSAIPTQDMWQKICQFIPYALFYPYIQKEICVFSPAYKENQMHEILHYATHIIFNSLAQWERFKPMIEAKNTYIKECYNTLLHHSQAQGLHMPNEIPQIKVGLRINPLYSEVTPPIYNPCIPKSRLGITPNVFHTDMQKLAKKYGYADSFAFFKQHFSGLHFHTHCEQDSNALKRTLPHVIQHFGDYITHCKWVNFGGGHHITRNDYDCALLVKIIRDFRTQYNGIQVMLEPGEAVGWQTGDLIGEVVDIIENDGLVAILDISASCHMPDCLEMPYRPECYKITKDSNKIQIERDLGIEKGAYCYRFGGPTCLAGDVIGDYSFNTPLQIGDRIAFVDMMHYTIVKNTTFNGVELPSLGIVQNGNFTLLKQFDYTHFKERN